MLDPVGSIGRDKPYSFGQGKGGFQNMSEKRRLSPSQVNKGYQKTRNKGQAEQDILDLIESGDAYIDLMELPHNIGNKLDSVYNSYNTNAKKLMDKAAEEAEKNDTESTFPEIKAVKFDLDEDEEYDTVLLINVPVHLAELAAEVAEGHAADEATEAA